MESRIGCAQAMLQLRGIMQGIGCQWPEKLDRGVAAALTLRGVQALTHAIQRSCINKAEVVAADEREGGVRATLNLGHTFGHAMETVSGYGATAGPAPPPVPRRFPDPGTTPFTCRADS